MTYRKKKLHDVTSFLLHTFTAKKIYRNCNIHWHVALDL